MRNNYGNFPDYQNNYENSRKDQDDQKIIFVEKKKDRDISILKEKFRNYTKLHWNEFKYTLLGLIIAILFLTIGFFRTLLVIILFFIGNSYGKFKDGDPRILFWLDRLIRKY